MVISWLGIIKQANASEKWVCLVVIRRSADELVRMRSVSQTRTGTRTVSGS